MVNDRQWDETCDVQTKRIQKEKFSGPGPAWNNLKEKAKLATDPLDTQVGGSHYSSMAIQPFEYIHRNGIGFAEGCVIKYVSRWRSKGGIEDLQKAKHFIDLLIQAEGTK